MNIYVGNMAWETSEDDLRQVFERYGQVTSINIIKDKFSGHPLGFGFVEMPGHKQAQQAINALNKTKINNRVVMVSETKTRIERRAPVRKK